MSTIAHALVSALWMAFSVGWEILWALILGFALSGVVQAVVTGRMGGACGYGHVGRRRWVDPGTHRVAERFHRDQPLFRSLMDWASIWIDIVLGLLIVGALAAWVPNEFWQAFFLSADPVGSKIVRPLIGPIVAVFSFVCSIGNVPLAAVLWNGGISFGGVIAFLFADLIILPILDIYRRYYGLRVALLLLGVSYAAMVGAAYVVELIFAVAGLVSSRHLPAGAIV